jgi:maleamate amidohydrolase
MDSFEDHCWKDLLDEDLLDIYAPYRRELRVGDRPALLLVDLYNLAYAGGPLPVRDVVRNYPSSCGVRAHEAIAPTQRLLSLARSSGWPVVYSTTATHGVTRATLRRGSLGEENSFEIYEALAPRQNEVVVAKERASCFFGTPLVAYLNQLRVDSLVVCGQTTSGCVRATVVDSYSYGFHTVLVEEDCTFDRSELSHKVSMFDLHHKYADVFTTGQLVRQFAGG